jgi:anti-anti-sigma regulatory factor
VIATNSQTHPQTCRIAIAGDRAVGYRRELRIRVLDALERGERHIVVDCLALSDVDLLLLSALVDCAATCGEQKAQFQLENLRVDLKSRIDALRLAGRLGLDSPHPRLDSPHPSGLPQLPGFVAGRALGNDEHQ